MKREYFWGGEVCAKFAFMMMFWKVDLGLPYYFWFSIELKANLPMSERFFQRNCYMIMKSIDFQFSNEIWNLKVGIS